MTSGMRNCSSCSYWVVKCAVVAYLHEKRRAQDSTIYLVGVAERLTVAIHLFIGAPTQEAPLLETEFIADGNVV